MSDINFLKHIKIEDNNKKACYRHNDNVAPKLNQKINT